MNLTTKNDIFIRDVLIVSSSSMYSSSVFSMSMCTRVFVHRISIYEASGGFYLIINGYNRILRNTRKCV